MAYTFIKAKGGTTGNSLFEEELIENAKEILTIAEESGKEIILPEDSLASTDFDNNEKIKTFKTSEIEEGWMGLDIGGESIEKFNKAIISSNTIFWNGPMGVFEMPNFAVGTQSIAKALVTATEQGATTIIGGGDSASAIKQAGLSDQVSHVSTGGGASLEYLEGKELPGLSHLTDK